MRLDTRNEEQVRRYLLGDVSEDERIRIEERLMVDGDFFDQVGLQEDELVDDYVDGRLSREDRSRFESLFLCAPERQHKLRFARALRARLADAPKPVWWQRLLGMTRMSQPVLASCLTASLLVIAFGGAWVLVRMDRLERRADELRAELHTSAAAGSAGPSAPQAAPVAVWMSGILSPGTLRSEGTGRRLAVPEGTLVVRLTLDLPSYGDGAYRAVLSGENGEILTRSGLRAERDGSQSLLRLDVPASALPPADYLLEVFEAAGRSPVADYSFRMSR